MAHNQGVIFRILWHIGPQGLLEEFPHLFIGFITCYQRKPRKDSSCIRIDHKHRAMIAIEQNIIRRLRPYSVDTQQDISELVSWQHMQRLFPALRIQTVTRLVSAMYIRL